MVTETKKLELQIQYINDDISELKTQIKNCASALLSYKHTLSQLESDKKIIEQKLKISKIIRS